jgi:hypothetical protein
MPAIRRRLLAWEGVQLEGSGSGAAPAPVIMRPVVRMPSSTAPAATAMPTGVTRRSARVRRPTAKVLEALGALEAEEGA